MTTLPTWADTQNYVGAIHADRSETVWMPIPGFPEHFASNMGQILNIKGPNGLRRLLTLGHNVSGHLTVTIRMNGKSRKFYVHRLVLLAFVGEPRPGEVACHYDDDPANNHLDNLRWDTTAANGKDHARTIRTGKPLKVQPLLLNPYMDTETLRLGERHNAILEEVAELTRHRVALIEELDTIRGHLKHES